MLRLMCVQQYSSELSVKGPLLHRTGIFPELPLQKKDIEEDQLVVDEAE